MKDLTSRQKEILDLIKDHLKEKDFHLLEQTFQEP